MAFHLRKAPPTDFSDLMDHHECFLIDIHDDPVQFLELRPETTVTTAMDGFLR